MKTITIKTILVKPALILTLCILMFCEYSHSQTIGQFTLWNQNHYLVNPAAAGNQNYFDAAMGYRKQWSGIENAPQTIYAVAHTVLNRPETHQRSAIRISNTNNRVYRKQKNFSKPMLKHAAGVQLSNAAQGAFERTEAVLSYALHLPVVNDISLSFGLSAGLNSFSFDESVASVLNERDPIFNAYVNGQASNQMNVNAGTYLYSDRFFIGYSANQILQNDLEIADADIAGATSANLEMQHFFMGGFNIDLTNDFRLTPNLLVKLAEPNPSFIDLGLNLSYQQFIYVGMNYRTDKAFTTSLGINVNYFVKVGYAYDYTTSDLSGTASGSHEFFIGLTLY